MTFVADWGEAHPATCDCCGLERWVLTFNADAGETVVDLCRPCALGLAGQQDELRRKVYGR